MPPPLNQVKAASPSDDRPFDYPRAFSRNIGIVSEHEQEILRTKRVAIPGCGGVGGLYALMLARAGVGKFHLADFDAFEIENHNRQFGSGVATLGQPKVTVSKAQILDINPTADVTVFDEGVTSENLDHFLNGVDVVIDSLDFFAFEARENLFERARTLGVTVITAAPLGLSTALLIFAPRSMSFQHYFAFSPRDDAFTRALKFGVGLAPRALQRIYMDPAKIRLSDGGGPSHVVGVGLCGAVATTEAIKILLGRGPIRPSPHYLQFDAYRGKLVRGYLRWGNRNPVQILKMWFFRTFLVRRT